jgi:hypothetical protein
MVRRTVAAFKITWVFDLTPWGWGQDRGESRRRVSTANALLWVLAHPSDFMDGPDDAYYTLQKRFAGSSVLNATNYETTRREVLKKIHELFDSIYYFADPECDPQSSTDTCSNAGRSMPV